MDSGLLLKELQSRGNFSPEDFQAFLNLWEPKEFRKNEMLLKAGEIPRFTIFVLKGCLRQYVTNDKGNEQIIYFAEESWWAGDLQAMRNNVPSELNLQALEDCSVLAINRDNWEYAFKTFPWWAEMHVKGHQRWVAKLQQQVGQSLTETAETKYLRLLRERPKLLQRVPQYQIATFLGITPEALSRIRKKIFNM